MLRFPDRGPTILLIKEHTLNNTMVTTMITGIFPNQRIGREGTESCPWVEGSLAWQEE